jgi:hypothetical protein
MDLRLTVDMPASRSPSPSGSRSAFQECLGAHGVRLPLLTSENVAVWKTVAPPSGGMCRWSAGSAGHSASRAPGGATTRFCSGSEAGPPPPASR